MRSSENQNFKNYVFDFDIIEIAENAMNTVVDAMVNTYETVKNEVKNLSVKIHHTLFPHHDSKSHSNTESITSLTKHIEELKRTIESSKIYMRAIIEKIRYQGKIKIINELNNNPQHPEYESSFPDLFTVTPKPNNFNIFYPFTRLDETFNEQGRQNISKLDKNFRSRMNQSIQKDFYKKFIDKNSWNVSNQLTSSKNIHLALNEFEKIYKENEKFSHVLDKKFMSDLSPCLFIVNNHVIDHDNKKKMIQDFQKMIPDFKYQRLISTYANPKLIYYAYLQFISEHPEISQYNIKNSRNIYKVDVLDNNLIKLTATNFSDLDIKNNNFIQKYKSFGLRATVIISLNQSPIMKYSHFIK